jgi:hypothetical protein
MAALAPVALIAGPVKLHMCCMCGEYVKISHRCPKSCTIKGCADDDNSPHTIEEHECPLCGKSDHSSCDCPDQCTVRGCNGHQHHITTDCSEHCIVEGCDDPQAHITELHGLCDRDGLCLVEGCENPSGHVSYDHKCILCKRMGHASGVCPMRCSKNCHFFDRCPHTADQHEDRSWSCLFYDEKEYLM